jgi:hypothetical protein
LSLIHSHIREQAYFARRFAHLQLMGLEHLHLWCMCQKSPPELCSPCPPLFTCMHSLNYTYFARHFHPSCTHCTMLTVRAIASHS